MKPLYLNINKTNVKQNPTSRFWKLYSDWGFHCIAPLSSVWDQVAPLPESGPLHGHTVVQFPLHKGLGGVGLSHVGFDLVSCCSSKNKIRSFMWIGVGGTDTWLCWDGEECNLVFVSTDSCLCGWYVTMVYKMCMKRDNVCWQHRSSVYQFSDNL